MIRLQAAVKRVQKYIDKKCAELRDGKQRGISQEEPGAIRRSKIKRDRQNLGRSANRRIVAPASDRLPEKLQRLH